MPPSMNPAFLSSSLREAQNLAEIQPSSGPRIQPLQFQMQNEPGYQNSQRISPADLRVLRDKFPQLSEFSEEFLQSRTLEELLRMNGLRKQTRSSLVIKQLWLRSSMKYLPGEITAGQSSIRPDSCLASPAPPPRSSWWRGR